MGEKKKYEPKQAQDFLAETNLALREFSMIRKDLKQFLLETHIANLIAKDQEELRFNFWHEDFEITNNKITDVIDEHCFCIEQMEADSIKKISQGSFVDFCYWFSEYAWLQGRNSEALKYSIQACQKKVDWHVEGLVPSGTLINWLELVNNIKHKESFIKRTKPIFTKRRLPKPKPQFEKKQKMFIPEQVIGQMENI